MSCQHENLLPTPHVPLDVRVFVVVVYGHPPHTLNGSGYLGGNIFIGSPAKTFSLFLLICSDTAPKYRFYLAHTANVET